MAGCMAGAAGTVVTYPMETLRTHMALGGQTYRECLADVLRTHGRRGLYKGFTSGVVRPTPDRSTLHLIFQGSRSLTDQCQVMQSTSALAEAKSRACYDPCRLSTSVI